MRWVVRVLLISPGSTNVIQMARALLESAGPFTRLIADQGYDANHLRIEYAARKVSYKGRQVRLTRKEYDILCMLAEHAGQVVTHKQLLHAAWNGAMRPSSRIMLPKAEGGASVTHLHAKLSAREAMAGLPEGEIGIVALATETASSLFTTGTYRGSSSRLAALTWGAEDLSADLGAEANRDEQGRFLDPYRLARTLCIAGAAAAGVPAIDTVYVDFKNDSGLRQEAEEARRDRIAFRG